MAAAEQGAAGDLSIAEPENLDLSARLFAGMYSRPGYRLTKADAYKRLLALAPSKPIWIGEIGCAPEGGDKAAWVLKMFSEWATRYPRIEAIVWFNLDKERDWMLRLHEQLDCHNTAVSVLP